jgi:hypothetical protein
MVGTLSTIIGNEQRSWSVRRETDARVMDSWMFSDLPELLDLDAALALRDTQPRPRIDLTGSGDSGE